MAKRKRKTASRLVEDSLSGEVYPVPNRPLPVHQPAIGTPSATEVTDGATVGVLALMLFLVPAIGAPFQEMLQDTLKSMVASFLTLGAALLFFWQQRKRQQPLRWHAIMWFPLALMVYALGSMVWSHTYLAGVEAIRWFIFSLVVWLGLNTFSQAALPLLARAIHWGAVIASLWTALQFWFNFSYFPQGPNPASTFVNRNFFAEMVVCAVPFSAWLLAQERRLPRIVWMAFSSAFLIVAVMMTGTRSALVTLWFTLFAVLPLIACLYRRQFEFMQWDWRRRVLAPAVLLVSVLGLGLLNSGNPLILDEERGTNALERGVYRSASVVRELSNKKEFATGSVSVRLLMWKATWRMIATRPVSGVGAGAWEVDAPLYQNADSPLETDYYAHNEILQLLAEYGLVGWAVLAGLLGYLLLSAWLTFKDRKLETAEGATRAILLTSLLSLLLVSNAGFPWRLASTCIIFAAVLGMLAASDARRNASGWSWSSRLPWRPVFSRMAVYASIFFLMLTAYISEQAAATEYKIITAVKRALMISQSGDPTNPRWNKTKNEMLVLMDEGTRINPHYRKITPMVADHLARWGDWENATWIWESVVESRPYVVAMLSNIARGYSQMGNYDKALEFVERCKKVQPDSPSVRTLEILVLARAGREPQAARLAREYLDQGIYDYDLLNAAISLGLRTGDYDLSLEGLSLRNKSWPQNQVEALLEMGRIYAEHKKNDALALQNYKAALEASPEATREATRQKIPAAYLPRF
jgi:O-antigen ligase